MYAPYRSRAFLKALAVLALVLLFLSQSYNRLGVEFHRPHSVADFHISTSRKISTLPDDYSVASSSETPWCQDRFSTRYLENARNFSVSLCNDESTSRLTCFFSSTAPDDPPRVDAMCHARRAVFDESSRRFRLGCEPRPIPPDELARGVPVTPEYLPRYWYETGPGFVVNETIRLDKTMSAKRPKTTTVLLKREGIGNLWHSLMEVMSLSWSLDVLRIGLDAETGKPFLSRDAADTTQLVIADDHEDGPFIDLWKYFARMPVRRIRDLNSSEPVTDIIIPFAGGSNPLWQGDWDDLLCRDSVLVKVFISRALSAYRTGTPIKDDNSVKVTFIRRTNTRKLIDEDAHMLALKDRIPHIKLNVVDFATMPFAEQLDIVRGTDLLVGVHGAGLTHLMFLQPGSAVLEILPEGFQHKGFRNLAQMLGMSYFRAHAKMHGDAGGDNQWQFDNVEMETERLRGKAVLGKICNAHGADWAFRVDIL
ncbi:hypothetical protein HIM_06287 [Hirsutella minnesotensis 3608]|uniref:EGF domain-specific O-linked N-acetylglucosamine transferase n=1 Tax=Hirsutella minnesotensis 3608 TaxID=1043627 RepID=A0A0F7ZJC2_9HYPO|nr:hypothetical protein HIM_06287 [Hirsutella minnesotensis 3608]